MTSSIRPALLILALLPTFALGQAKVEEVDGKVSNDQPGRPLQMPPASTEVKEAIDDFDRFGRRGAWERALKALYTIPEEQALRFIDGEGGFIIPVARKRRTVLTALPPEGQAAYRLFYDAEAKRLFEGAEGASELKDLERVYSAYFVSSVGDNAADRLGDLYFELGRFDRAADCWLAILRDRPDTDLSPALVSLKAALALSHAGRRSEFERIRTELADRYADETVTVGGEAASPAELLPRLLGETAGATDPREPGPRPADAGPDVSGRVDAAWQVRFADSVEAGMTPAESTQWRANPLRAAVPAVAIEGTRLFANYLGHVFALDLQGGKMLWRSGSFHHLEVSAMQDQARALDSSRFAVVASGDHIWTLGRDLKEQNYLAPFRLSCRRAEGGEVTWQSTDLPDYAGVDLVGPPLLAGGKLFIAGKGQGNPQQQGQPQQSVLAIQPHDGKVIWKTDVGTFRQGQQYSYYGNREPTPQPQLLLRAGALYVDTHVGVLARLDAESGALDWGYGYQTDHVQSQGRIFFMGESSPSQGPTTGAGPPLLAGESLLFKGMQSGRLHAVEPSRMKATWDRPIAKSSRLLGADDRTLILGGPEICALDLETRALLWATRVPDGSMNGRVLVRPDGIWQLTPRGVFEIDPRSGAVRRIFRGNDLGAVGGDLFLTDRLLVAVSNRTISAYPRRGNAAEVSDVTDPTTTKVRASND